MYGGKIMLKKSVYQLYAFVLIALIGILVIGCRFGSNIRNSKVASATEPPVTVETSSIDRFGLPKDIFLCPTKGLLTGVKYKAGRFSLIIDNQEWSLHNGDVINGDVIIVDPAINLIMQQLKINKIDDILLAPPNTRILVQKDKNYEYLGLKKRAVKITIIQSQKIPISDFPVIVA